MATSAGIRVEGMRTLRATLRKAGDDLSDLKEAHAAAAGIVVPAARASAPRRTGRLAGNVRGSGTKTGAVIRAGGARVPYAAPIHWGWEKRGIAPNPFISTAAQNTEPTWTRVYEAGVERVLSRIKGI